MVSKRKLQEELLLTIMISTCATALNNQKKRKHTAWMKQWFQKRKQKGAYNNIIQELQLRHLPY